MSDLTPEMLRSSALEELRGLLADMHESSEDETCLFDEGDGSCLACQCFEQVAYLEADRKRLAALELDRKIISGVLAGQVASMRRRLDSLYELAHDLRQPPTREETNQMSDYDYGPPVRNEYVEMIWGLLSPYIASEDPPDSGDAENDYLHVMENVMPDVWGAVLELEKRMKAVERFVRAHDWIEEGVVSLHLHEEAVEELSQARAAIDWIALPVPEEDQSYD